MRRTLPIISILLFILAFVVVSSRQLISQVTAALASHVVISEVQVGGAVAGDEFVELYNPTNSSITVTGWRLTRKTETGATESNLVASMSGSIAAHGYLLIAPAEYDGTPTEDIVYSTASRIAGNNTVLIYSDAGVTLVDKVGLGTATDVETAGVPNPETDGSVERKPGASMPTGGNGEDTDHNANDFAARTTSEPQNAASPTETPDMPTGSVTPTNTPTMTPTGTVSPTMSPTNTPTSTPTGTVTITPTMTLTSTPTMTPTGSPIVTPTSTPIPTVTGMPTATPTATVTITPTTMVTMSPTVTPTITMTPTPMVTPQPPSREPQIIAAFPLGNKSVVVCSLKYQLFGSHFMKVWFPVVTCQKITVNL
jgi:hypothetical protein